MLAMGTQDRATGCLRFPLANRTHRTEVLEGRPSLGGRPIREGTVNGKACEKGGSLTMVVSLLAFSAALNSICKAIASVVHFVGSSVAVTTL